MKINKKLIFTLLLLLSFWLTGCGGGETETAPEAIILPSATPTTPPLPAFDAPEGWLRYEGRRLEIWLPGTYFGGDPTRDLTLFTQYLKQYDPDGQRLSLIVERYHQNMNFYAFNTVPTPSGILTSVNITTEVISPLTTMEKYIEVGLSKIPAGIEMVSHEVGKLNNMETGKIIYDFLLPNEAIGRMAQYILRTSESEIWVLTFSTSLEEFDAQSAIFQQAVRSFRNDEMLQQAEDAVEAGEPTPTPPGLLFFDDFSNDLSGWAVANDELISRYYAEGSYHFYIFQNDIIASSTIGESRANVRVEADAWVTNPRGEEAFAEVGIVCGYKSATDYYFLSIRSDGHFGIFQTVGDQQNFMGMEDWLPHPAISKGNAPNHLTAECVGNTLRFFVNGQPLGEATTAVPLEGQAGVYGGSFSWADTHVQFDNFTVTRINP